MERYPGNLWIGYAQRLSIVTLGIRGICCELRLKLNQWILLHPIVPEDTLTPGTDLQPLEPKLIGETDQRFYVQNALLSNF